MYERSETSLDQVSQFTPASFLGRGPVRTLRGRLKFGALHARRLGFLDTLFSSDLSAPTSAEAALPADNGSFDWNQAIGDLGQLYQTYTQAQLTKDLYQTNLQRQAQGLAPIPASAVAPQVNVGVAPDTQKTIMYVGLGGAAILGLAFATGMIGGRKKRRR